MFHYCLSSETIKYCEIKAEDTAAGDITFYPVQAGNAIMKSQQDTHHNQSYGIFDRQLYPKYKCSFLIKI